MSAISVSHLSKSFKIYKKDPGFLNSIKSLFYREYETVKAVNDISFEIAEGELIGFIGPNGAGKTTTLKCLSGLLYPSSGDVKVLGYTPFDRKHDYLRKISLVMGQKNQLWWDLPGMETLMLNKEIYGIPREKFNEVVNDLAKILDAASFFNVPVRKLSLGQRMKMELMAALIHSPKVLFLDEPTIGLDVLMQKNLRDFIKEYNRKYNATIILTSHYMADVEQLCKRVIIINHGRILYDGLLSDLVKKNSNYKIISIVLKDFVDPKKIALLGNVKKFYYPELVIQVTRKNANIVLSRIIKQLPIDDIKIEDPDIEDVIREVFTESKNL